MRRKSTLKEKLRPRIPEPKPDAIHTFKRVKLNIEDKKLIVNQVKRWQLK